MDYLKYNKYVINFEEPALGNEISAKFKKDPAVKIKGYAKLETGNRKGMISLHIQNLKYYEKPRYLYKLVLLGRKDDKVIYVNGGTIMLNRYGQGGIVFNFDPSDINSRKSGLHEFSSIVVAAISTFDADEDIYPVLLAELPALSGIETPAESVDVTAFFLGNNQNTDDHQPEIIQEATPDTEAPKANVKAARVANIESNQEEPCPNSPRIYNSYYNEIIKTVCTQIYQNNHLYEVVSPFGNGISGIRWYKIMNIMNIPFINATYQFANSDYIKTAKYIDDFIFPSCQDMSRKYRHFIFGISAKKPGSVTFDSTGNIGDAVESIHKYYFGIPGMYCKEEQPDGGRSGFRYWQPLRGGNRQQNTYGYWIAAVDADTGDIEEIVP